MKFDKITITDYHPGYSKKVIGRMDYKIIKDYKISVLATELRDTGHNHNCEMDALIMDEKGEFIIDRIQDVKLEGIHSNIVRFVGFIAIYTAKTVRYQKIFINCFKSQ